MAKENTEHTDPRLLKIGEVLKNLRHKAGYSSYETFAFEKGLNRVQYWRMEKGQNITLKSLFKVLDIHSLSLVEFFKLVEV